MIDPIITFFAATLLICGAVIAIALTAWIVYTLWQVARR